MAKPKITVKKYDTDEWSIEVNGEWVGDLMRSKPMRYSSSGSSLYAVDREKPWRYTLSWSSNLGFPNVDLQEGIDLKGAKAEAKSFVEEMILQ